MCRMCWVTATANDSNVGATTLLVFIVSPTQFHESSAIRCSPSNLDHIVVRRSLLGSEQPRARAKRPASLRRLFRRPPKGRVCMSYEDVAGEDARTDDIECFALAARCHLCCCSADAASINKVANAGSALFVFITFMRAIQDS